MLRARHLFFAWLAYGALQLALLGIPGASGQLAIGSREAHGRTASQSVSIVKRLLAPDESERRTAAPFAPSAYVRLDVPVAAAASRIAVSPRQAIEAEPLALPLARAPPALA